MHGKWVRTGRKPIQPGVNRNPQQASPTAAVPAVVQLAEKVAAAIYAAAGPAAGNTEPTTYEPLTSASAALGLADGITQERVRAFAAAAGQHTLSPKGELMEKCVSTAPHQMYNAWFDQN